MTKSFKLIKIKKFKNNIHLRKIHQKIALYIFYCQVK